MKTQEDVGHYQAFVKNMLLSDYSTMNHHASTLITHDMKAF